MARIISSDGAETTNLPAIQARLARLGITLNFWEAPQSPRARELMDRQALNEAEREELLQFVEPRFEELKRTQGYAARDMVVIHEDIPGLADMLAKFDKVHVHTDDEVRYVLAGRGYFGFIEPDDGQFLLEVSEGDYINVPANAEHWFEMRDSKRIKAVRYFVDTTGWTPVYTRREVVFG